MPLTSDWRKNTLEPDEQPLAQVLAFKRPERKRTRRPASPSASYTERRMAELKGMLAASLDRRSD